MLAANRHYKLNAGSVILPICSDSRMAAVRKSTRALTGPMIRRAIGQVETASRPRAGTNRSAVNALHT